MIELEKVKNELFALGYENFKTMSSKTLSIFVPSKHRMETFQHLLEELEDSFHERVTNFSSLGLVKYKNIKILIKPIEYQGTNSPGISNEMFLLDMANTYIKKYKAINIEFYSKDLVIKLEKIKQIHKPKTGHQVGTRSDLIFISDTKEHNFSIKKDNSEYWGSPETYYGAKAKVILESAIKNKLVNLIDHNGYYSLDKQLAFHSSNEDKQFLVFGTDNCNLIKRTFKDEDFTFNKTTKTLKIKISSLATTLDDLNKIDDVFFLLMNCKSRCASTIGIKGLSLKAVTSRRVFGAHNIVLVKNPHINFEL